MDLERRYQECISAMQQPFSMARARQEYMSTIAAMKFESPYIGAGIQWPEEKEGLKPVPKHQGVRSFFAVSVPDLREVAKAVYGAQSYAMSVMAPPGVGKSTIFPNVLRSYYGKKARIVVLEPTEELAAAQVHNITKGGGKAQYAGTDSYVDDYELGVDAVAYTTPSDMILRLRRNLFEDDSIVIVHDECHENDYATYTLRSIWKSYPAVHKYIVTSATLPAPVDAADTQRRNEAPALEVKRVKFPDELAMTGADVLPSGEAAPWSLKGLYGRKTLMFIERDKVAHHVANLYANLMEVHTLRRGDTFKKYLQVVEALEHAGSSGIVVIVDSAYQSGYTFKVDRVVDTGHRRQTVDVGGTEPQDSVRRVTEAERRQRVERVGRLSAGVAFVPEWEPISRASVLAPGEVGSAVALFYLLGFELPQELKQYDDPRFMKADLPCFLSSGLPWALWVRERYKEREPFIDNKCGSADSADMLEGFMHWANSVEVKIREVGLKSGEFYSTATGEITADSKLVDSVVASHGDIYAWLRYQIGGNRYKPLEDNSPVEMAMIWSVWLTAWNTNVAKLHAIDAWRVKFETQGVVKNNWLIVPENRAYMELLIQYAGEIKSKWDVLRNWYGRLFSAYPVEMRICSLLKTLIDAQLRVLEGVMPNKLVEPVDQIREVTSNVAKLAVAGGVDTSSLGKVRVPEQRVVCGIEVERHVAKNEIAGNAVIRDVSRSSGSRSSGNSLYRAKTYCFPKYPGGSGRWV